MATLVSRSGPALRGTVTVPGDKSISHRALMLSALAEGGSRISGLSEGQDVLNTIRALQALGVGCEKQGKIWTVTGVGGDGFRPPKNPLDFGNSATGARLMMGVLAATSISANITGDDSLKKRPMDRVLQPLIEMGAKVIPGVAVTLPFTFMGTTKTRPITYTMPVASAQVKSAILLASLKAEGQTTIIEPISTRDHSERLLAHFGVPLEMENITNGGKAIKVAGPCNLTAADISIPGDFSAAAFLLVGGLLVPGSGLTIRHVGLNPTRTGLLDVLQNMGADIIVSKQGEKSGEPFGDVTVKYSQLTGISTNASQAPLMIDEFPILFVAAASAKGVSTFHGLAELRLKESDRLGVMAQGLRACGVEVVESEDGLEIHGREGEIPGGAEIESPQDHRIALAFSILGLVTKHPITIKGSESISTSFPGFARVLRELGAIIGDVRV